MLELVAVTFRRLLPLADDDHFNTRVIRRVLVLLEHDSFLTGQKLRSPFFLNLERYLLQ